MKILLVQTSFLGDVILSTPVIKAIKDKFPEAELYIMTTPQARDLVCRDPLLSEALIFDKRGKSKGVIGLIKKARELRSMKFDRAYALQRSIRTCLLLKLACIPYRIGFKKATFSRLFYQERRPRPKELHDVLRNLSIIYDANELNECSAEMRLFPCRDDEVNPGLMNLIQANPKIAVMAPGSAWETKRWNERGYQEVFHKLQQIGLTPFVIGSAKENKIAEFVASERPELNLAGKISLSETAYLIKKAGVLICNDSMSLHMGSALKTPTVAIFCATSPSFGFGPWKNKAEIVECKDLKCKPCARHGSKICPNGTNACRDKITSNDVMAAVRKLLGEEQT